MDDHVIQILGIAAGVCTSLSLIPQVVKIVREKKANDISLTYLIVLLVGFTLWITYGIGKKDLPVIVTNVVSLIVNVVTLILGMKYKKNPGN
jgi:MtN3 and saliva related transmembrane protein